MEYRFEAKIYRYVRAGMQTLVCSSIVYTLNIVEPNAIFKDLWTQLVFARILGQPVYEGLE